jgi:hypothetical protein
MGLTFLLFLLTITNMAMVCIFVFRYDKFNVVVDMLRNASLNGLHIHL